VCDYRTCGGALVRGSRRALEKRKPWCLSSCGGFRVWNGAKRRSEQGRRVRRGSATSRSAQLLRPGAATRRRPAGTGTRAAARQLATSRSNTTPASSRSLAASSRVREHDQQHARSAYRFRAHVDNRRGGLLESEVAFLLPSTTRQGDERSVDQLRMGRTTSGFRVPLRAWICPCTPSAVTSPQGQMCQLCASCRLTPSCQTGF
jgi:hypothetical protein